MDLGSRANISQETIKRNPHLHSKEHVLADKIWSWSPKAKGDFGQILGRIKQMGYTYAYAKWAGIEKYDACPSKFKAFMATNKNTWRKAIKFFNRG